MKVYESYQPNAKQKRFHEIPPWRIRLADGSHAESLIKLYFGGLGSGKSTACEQEQALVCLRTPGGKSIALRKSMDRSDISIIEDYKRIFAGHGRWVASKSWFELDNGHLLIVTPADKFDRFGSVEFVTFYMQEAQEMSYVIFDALQQRLRHPAGVVDGVNLYRGYLCARGVKKDHWIYQEIAAKGWNADDPAEKRAEVERPNFVCIQGRTDDNTKNLRPGYKDSLLLGHKNDRRWQLMFLEGEFGFDITGKAVFDEYDPRIHEAAIDPDPTLPILRGVDFGFRHPAVAWCQYTREGRFVVLRELCPRDTPRHELVRMVEALQRAEFPEWHPTQYRDFGDIAGDAVNQTDITDIEFWENYFGTGIETRKGRVKEGQDVIHRLMTTTKKRDGDLVPMFLHDYRCERLGTALAGGYCYEEGSTEDHPDWRNPYKDIVDAVRYVAQIVAEEAPATSQMNTQNAARSATFAAY